MYPIGRSQHTLEAARFIVEKNVGKAAGRSFSPAQWIGVATGLKQKSNEVLELQ